ncbi:hypothetical protein KP509_02G066600 [Ceratopteris richardii]|uniref:Molybdenum cofactor sulfurase n=1 Tax=Ceratopteris richardii TaxID=49495 RepID=A0A8T2VDU6_CERRI|nr:hypothetical protein KP509_02G066600 [Ceratopteris richardii]KAH7444139.1 hypothetical protein KP509_02G066600 [Ceratopteris richardii]
MPSLQGHEHDAGLSKGHSVYGNHAEYCDDPRKQEFYSIYKEQYGYPKGELSIDQLRADEFPHLGGNIYLDHAGATLYSKSQVLANVEDLCKNLYGNPHSQSLCSNASSDVVSNAREGVLKFFNVTPAEYKCVFTAGATAALKLVGECFPWTDESQFCYTMENHNSVLGIREYALAAGGSACAVEVEGCGQQQSFTLRARQRRNVCSHCDSGRRLPFSLFAFPSECNFSGRKFDLGLIKSIQDGYFSRTIGEKWMVLLDAAKGCGTSQLDLSMYPADFVAISFYKIFGYPTGLGALLIRTRSSGILQKKYFGGGTVAACLADVDFVQRREGIEQMLEDGTVPFLGIAALHRGFLAINRLGISNIQMHAGSLAMFTALHLSGLKHANGSNLCILYNSNSLTYWGNKCNQGPTVTFNLRRIDGTWVGYREVEKLASLVGIHIRTGCFCNPGACSKFLGLSESDVRANLEAGHVCWDDHDVIDGKPTGAVRVSFGYMSTIEDALAFIDYIHKFFLNDGGCSLKLPGDPFIDCNLSRININGDHKSNQKIHLESITIYPIKSCGGFTVDSWPLSDSGLLYDREWALVNSSGIVLTQKKCPMMCMIKTHIEFSNGILIVSSPNMETRLEIPLFPASEEAAIIRVNMCGERSFGKSSAKEVTEWFTLALNTQCSLIRRQPKSRQVHSRVGSETQVSENTRELSYANEGQFLLVSQASIDELNRRTILTLHQNPKLHRQSTAISGVKVDAMRFRPNFVVAGGCPFEEDSWRTLDIGGHRFTVLGGCNRCKMINIDQSTGRSEEESNLLLALSSYRRNKGKILFGVLLANSFSGDYDEEQRTTHEGQIGKVIKAGSRVDVEI